MSATPDGHAPGEMRALLERAYRTIEKLQGDVMIKKKAKLKPPYYIARRLPSVEELEKTLNALRDQGFTIKEIMCGIETYTVVALMPDVL